MLIARSIITCAEYGKTGSGTPRERKTGTNSLLKSSNKHSPYIINWTWEPFSSTEAARNPIGANYSFQQHIQDNFFASPSSIAVLWFPVTGKSVSQVAFCCEKSMEFLPESSFKRDQLWRVQVLFCA